MLQRNLKGFAGDPLIIVLMFSIATIIFVLLAYIWTQFAPAIDSANANATIPISPQNRTLILAVGHNYFITGGQGTLLFFFFVMVIAMLISAYAEAAGVISMPISLFFLIMALITSMILSDTAHAILTSPALGSLVASNFSEVLYIEDSLPVVVGILGIAYIGFVIFRRNQSSGGSNYSGRVSSG